MYVVFVIFFFSICMSGCTVKEVIDAVVNVVPLIYGNVCGNISN